MKQVTISIPDNLYKSFMQLFKHIPEVTISETKEFVVSEEQKKLLDLRRKTSKPGDFIPWQEAKKQLKFKIKK